MRPTMRPAAWGLWLVAVAAVACGAARRNGPPPQALEKARTLLVPDGERCPDAVGDTRPVIIVANAGDARPIGRITATRHSHDAQAACAWAEDGAATAARRLGGDAVLVTSRRPSEEDGLVACVVEVRVLLRGEGEFLRRCEREEIRGVRDPEEPS